MHDYGAFCQSLVKSLKSTIDVSVSQAAEFSLTGFVGDEPDRFESGSIVIFAFSVRSCTNSIFFEEIRAAIEGEAKWLKTLSGQLVIELANDHIVRTTYTPFNWVLAMNHYRDYQDQTHMSDELYKWELVKKANDGWKRVVSGETTFQEWALNLDWGNLVYYMFPPNFRKLVKAEAVEVEMATRSLAECTRPFGKGMEKFAHQLNELHVKQVENMGNKLFLTGRETACFATFLNPNLFTFFQKRLYKSVLLALQRSSDTSWENLDDYYDIVYEFNEKILPDYQDVLAVRNNLISQQKYFPDNHNLILIQDIFYVTFLKGSYLTIVHSESDELEEFEDRFEDVFKQLDPLKFSKYIAILKKFIDQHSLKIDDPRLAFTVSSSKIRLSFIINSRYCFNIYKLAEKTTFGFIYKSSLTNGQGYFVKSGKQEAFWNEVETIDTYVDHVFEGCAIELGRNRNSPYRKSNNAEFMALLFDKFRKPAMKSALNTILFGPPGTGKTYHTIDLAVKIAEPYQYQENNHEANKQIFDRLVIENRINFCTFHQSMSYEDFVEGLKPESDEETEQISYQVQSGIFKSISTRASSANKIGLNFDQAYDSLLREISGQGKIAIYETLARSREFTARVNRNNNIAVTPNTGKGTEMTITKESLKAFLETGEESDWPSYLKPFAHRMRNVHGYTSKENTNPEPYVLIIDEINRGNVSQIFGELITLLESDKREGKANALSVTLPYSKEKFSVPSNLYLIGTMNTADRSVEALDAALRRRFHFVEMPPRYDLVELQTIVAGSTLAQLLQTINDRMEKLLDKDHTLGHAYFLGVKNEEDLKNVFQEKIIPLLQEYFFGDIGKIGLVLGNSFIRSDERSFVGFAEFEYEDTSVVEDIKLRKVYKVSNPSEWRLDAIVGNPASNE